MGTIEPYATAAGRRYRVRYRTPDRRQTSKRGFTTKRDAERYLAAVEVSKDHGQWMDPTKSRVTVAEWAERWFRAQIQLKPTTRSGYRHGLDKHVLPRWGTVRLSEVEHSEVQAWVNALAVNLAPSTVRQTHLVLSGVLKFAVEDRRIPQNPSDAIRLPRVVRKSRGYLSDGEVLRLAEACGQYVDVVMFLAYTGLRWGEMAGLKVGRLDIERRRIDVAEAVSDPRGVVVWGTPKSHERRSVPFPEFLQAPLVRRCMHKHPEDLVFMGPDAGVLRSGNFRSRTFDKALASIRAADPDFPKVTPHDLRHTAASLAISAGANVKSVQRMLGHASAAMTLDVYADLFDDDLDAVAIALNQRVDISNVAKMWPEALK
jgi:integrase